MTTLQNMACVWQFLLPPLLNQHSVPDIDTINVYGIDFFEVTKRVDGQARIYGHLTPHLILFVLTHMAMLLFPSNQNDEEDRVFKGHFPSRLTFTCPKACGYLHSFTGLY